MPRKFTPAQIKLQSFESIRNLFSFPGVDASRVYVRAWALGCFYSHISTRTFRRALTASVRDSCAEIKECPFSGVTKSGRVWRKLPESDARTVTASLYRYTGGSRQVMASRLLDSRAGAHTHIYTNTTHTRTQTYIHTRTQTYTYTNASHAWSKQIQPNIANQVVFFSVINYSFSEVDIFSTYFLRAYCMEYKRSMVVFSMNGITS